MAVDSQPEHARSIAPEPARSAAEYTVPLTARWWREVNVVERTSYSKKSPSKFEEIRRHTGARLEGGGAA